MINNNLKKFNFSSQLNIEKALSYNPPKTVDVEQYKDLLENDDLLNNIKSYSPKLEQNLANHIGFEATFTYKLELIKSLKLIALRFNGYMDKDLWPITESEKACMLDKLNEEVENCTPGFFTRVNEIIISWSTVQNFDQLLHIARENIVARAAASTDLVHDANWFFTYANSIGLGVRPRNEFDTFFHVGSISKIEILSRIENTFKDNFTPYNLIILLSDSLKSALSAFYTGYRDDGYCYGDSSKIIEKLDHILNCDGQIAIDMENCFLIEHDEFDTPKCVDIDWYKINTALFNYLKINNYFQELIPKPENILDLIAFVKINSKNFTDAISSEYLKLINSRFQLCFVLSNLSTYEQSVFIRSLNHELKDLIDSEYDFIKLINNLPVGDILHVCEKLNPKFDHLFNSLESYLYMFKEILTEKLKIILLYFENNFKNKISSAYDINKIFRELTNSQIIDIINVVDVKVEKIITDIADVSTSVLALDFEKSYIFFKLFSAYAKKIINTTGKLIKLLQLLTQLQVTMLLKDFLPHIPIMINTMDDFSLILKAISDEEKLQLFNITKYKFIEIVKSVDELINMFFVLNYQQKLEMLYLIKENKEIKKYLINFIQTKDSLTCLFCKKLDPLQILQNEFSKFEKDNISAMMCSFAALSILMQYQQKAMFDKHSYYSEDMWEKLKEVAKTYFPGDYIDRIKRSKQHYLTWTYLICDNDKSIYGSQFPGDKYLKILLNNPEPNKYKLRLQNL